jgi:hypothetical protein
MQAETNFKAKSALSNRGSAKELKEIFVVPNYTEKKSRKKPAKKVGFFGKSESKHFVFRF